MQINSAEDLFANELIDIYSAEQRLSAALPRMLGSVQNDTVRQRLQERVQQGKNLLQQMDQILDQMKIPKDQQENKAIDGLIGNTDKLCNEIKVDQLKDSALIGAVQKIEHYCIASWGTAAALGRQCGQQQAVQAFERALGEGKQFDKQLTELAEEQANPAATKH